MNYQAIQQELKELFNNDYEILVCEYKIYINGVYFYITNVDKLEIQRCIKDKMLCCKMSHFNIYNIDILLKIKEKADDILKILLKHIED